MAMNNFKCTIQTLFLILVTLFFSCNDVKKNNTSKENIFFADINNDLNSFLKDYSKKNISSYYLEDGSRGKDSIKDAEFHYAALLYFKMNSIDSLYQMLPNIYWASEKYSELDTMVYINSNNIVNSDSKVSQAIKVKLVELINHLSNIQLQLKVLRIEMEELRPGIKNEKLNCQNCKFNVSSNEINKISTMAELYLEIEKQFVIIYRELACTTFAIELLDVRKVASNSYKVRI